MNSISSFIVTLFVLACAMQTVMSNDPKIINGELAVEGQFPFLIQLYNKTGHYTFCGGSLIGPYHVLTAAHCTVGAAASELQIWAGSLNLYDGQGTRVNVQAVYVHPDYDASTITNDVSVIRLVKPFAKSVGVRTVELAKTSAAVGTQVNVCGFGSIRPSGGTYPDDLMWVRIPIVSHTKCENLLGGTIPNNQILCAYDPHQGTCYGDSGGPLVTGSKTTAVQQGVVSFGSSDGCATAPSAFARVSYFRSWILAKTNHVVSTSCAGCAVDAEWRSLCQGIGGTFDRTANNYQCKNLDVDKTQGWQFAWSDCANDLVRDLCEKIGRYSCHSGEATCTPL
jgi:secreted trypsin-like serine protease